MAFTSFHFALFFAVVLLGLTVLRNEKEHKITFLLAAGAFFYGYWDWRFLLLIGFTSLFDFYMGLAIGAAQHPLKKRLLMLDIGVNLGILIIFKYFNFFLSSSSFLLGPFGIHFSALNILLPIGISFFVFEAMSYCIDIYRGHLSPYENWRHFALFIFFFPRMIAGPIIRASDFLPQLEREILITRPNVYAGGQMFLIGMTKKVVVADNLASFVDLVFASPGAYSTGTVWQAIIAYSIQIFCDFSGYSDMALGLAKILGFDLPVNFRMPYIATNLTDFWRRWHISLSTWLRDYLYISLGGNRKGQIYTYINLFITMVLGGLWHGASWNFVAWGFLHGLGLAVHKAFGAMRAGWKWRGDDVLSKAFSWALTYGYVCLCWVFFRSHSSADTLIILEKLFGSLSGGIWWISGPLCAIAPAVVLAHYLGSRWQRQHRHPLLQLSKFSHLAFLCFWILAIFFFSAVVSAPFIYFQF